MADDPNRRTIVEGTVLASRDYTDSAFDKLKAEIKDELREHYISYKDLWRWGWKVGVGTMGGAAGILYILYRVFEQASP